MKRRPTKTQPQSPLRVLEPRELARVSGGKGGNEIELPAPVPWQDDWLAPN